MEMALPHILFNVLGILGVLFILAAYCLMQVNILNNRQYRFQFMNLAGALLIMASLTQFWNLASFMIELAWASISVWGIYTIYRKRRHKELNEE